MVEARIDDSLCCYLEERALALALQKAANHQQRACLENLANLREELMHKRAVHLQEMTAKRHARGEFYSAAKVKSINALGPSKAELDHIVRTSYAGQPSATEVLKAHARIHFGYNLMSQQSLIACCAEDTRADVKRMYQSEAQFARAWLEAIGEEQFRLDIREQQRQAMRTLRSTKTSLYLVARPHCPQQDQLDLQPLARVWNKLDGICEANGLRMLSDYIGFEDQPADDDIPAQKVLATVAGLIAALETSGAKIPGKKAVRVKLEDLRRILDWLRDREGRIRFEVDF